MDPLLAIQIQDIPLSKEVQIALESASEEPFLWLGRIPWEHVASTIEAMRRERQLLSAAKDLLDRRKSLFHPTRGEHLLDRYDLCAPAESPSLNGEKGIRKITFLLSQLSKAQAQIARDVRLLQGNLSSDLRFELPLLVLPSKKLVQLTRLLPKLCTPSEIATSSIDCPSLFPHAPLADTSEAILEAIRFEEEKVEESTINRYKAWCREKASSLPVLERPPLLRRLEEELHTKILERESHLQHLKHCAEYLERAPEEMTVSLQGSLVERKSEKKKLQEQREERTEYVPSSLAGTPYDPELTDEESLYELSLREMSPRDEWDHVRNILSSKREKIASLTREINKLQVHCHTLKTLLT